MPSPDKRRHANLRIFGSGVDDWTEGKFSFRAIGESVLRGVSLATLALLIWQAFHLLRTNPAVWARGGMLHTALVEWSTREAPSHAHVVFDSVPTPDFRDWIAALPGVGTTTSWEGPSLKATAVTVEPVPDPQLLSRVWVAAPRGSSILLRDGLSEFNSVMAPRGTAVVTMPNLHGVVRAAVGGTTATAIRKDSLTVRPILVLGIAGWEGKFIMASLEEHGWLVDGRFALSPKTGGILIQGPPDPIIDTAHYAAVIALDTSASRYAHVISDFVHDGGGLIAELDAAALSAFASLMPAVTEVGNFSDAPFENDTVRPRSALALTPLAQLKPGAVAVEDRADDHTAHIAIAARRVGTGRVLQVGYRDTWRWRMEGVEADPVRDYNQWWSAMVSSVAYAPRTPLPVNRSVEATPMASLVATLGRAISERGPHTSFLDDPRLLRGLFGVLMGALLLEWASRRLRGKP